MEKLNKARKYDKFLKSMRVLSQVIEGSKLRSTVGHICVNYLHANPALSWARSILLGLAYLYLSDNIEQEAYLLKAIKLANKYIIELVGGLDLNNGRQVEDVVDQVCVVLLIFEWHPYLLWTLSDLLRTSTGKDGLWNVLCASLGREWGCLLVDKVVILGSNLPALEGQLK